MRVDASLSRAVAFRGLLWGLGASVAVAATEPKPSAPTPAAASEATTELDTDALFEAGRALFEEYAPPEVKAEYEFPSREQWNAFLPKLQAALESDSLAELSRYAPEARAVLATLRSAGIEPDLADWLQQRLDEIEGADEANRIVTTPPKPAEPKPPITPKPPRPGVPTPPAATPNIPYYDLWLGRVQGRPTPARAAELMPTLIKAFRAEGVPAGLVWLAEAESSFNPSARSPVGAKGLFQLMPETAKSLGLDTFMPDERTDPEKSARAAAKYLKTLHGRFGDWPLALAAYNAGEGRVSRTLAAKKAKDYAAIANALPAETRMYVPKVAALVAVRTGTPISAWK